MSETVALKAYFGVELAHRLSDLIKPSYPEFPDEWFVRAVADQVDPLPLKARVAVIADALHRALLPDYAQSLPILLTILGPENETEEGMFTNGYFLMPVAFYVEKYGLQHFDLSMHAMYEITKRHTSEYAIRPYLTCHQDACMEHLNKWRHDPNLHVRRLVSEGTRPRLPWAKRIPVLKGDPAHNLDLLVPLLNDPSLYVRKSVANHLNDLTKDYREATLDWLQEQIDRIGRDEHFAWIMGHALRSLVKSGDVEASALLEKL